jgi:hypothetical protein
VGSIDAVEPDIDRDDAALSTTSERIVVGERVEPVPAGAGRGLSDRRGRR